MKWLTNGVHPQLPARAYFSISLALLLRPPRQQKALGREAEGILAPVTHYRGNRTAVRSASISRSIARSMKWIALATVSSLIPVP